MTKWNFKIVFLPMAGQNENIRNQIYLFLYARKKLTWVKICLRKLNLHEPNQTKLLETMKTASSTTRAATSCYGDTKSKWKLILQITKILFHVKDFLEIKNLIFHSCLSVEVHTASNSVIHNSMISLILQLVKLIIGFSFNNLKYLF